MRRSLSASQVLSVRNRTIEVPREWEGCLGKEIARNGVVFFWGNSGNGKSSAVMSFAKMLTGFGTVLYVSREEGFGLSFQHTLERFSMTECGVRFQVADDGSIEQLTERLDKHRSPEFVVIDSVQMMGMSFKDYRALKDRFPRKLFILVSQANGKQPDGRPATKMMYDADLKIWVEGYTAHSKGRFIGPTGAFRVWDDGAERYWTGKAKEDEQNAQKD